MSDVSRNPRAAWLAVKASKRRWPVGVLKSTLAGLERAKAEGSPVSDGTLTAYRTAIALLEADDDG